MMNGAKKSDSSIVPAKLANKAERSAAESVEGDDGTKRNAELQSTVRTQSREAVTQAQARIRGAVTRNKKEKLTALLHHVSIDVLRWAFFNLKKRAAPGADGLTWADYAAGRLSWQLLSFPASASSLAARGPMVHSNLAVTVTRRAAAWA